MRRDEARLLDMTLAAQEAMGFVADVSQEGFLADRKLQSAVCMQLEIVGEAARALSDEFKASHPEVPWRDVVGLRHRIVHEYFRLDLDVIWETVKRDLPELLGHLGRWAPSEDQG